MRTESSSRAATSATVATTRRGDASTSIAPCANRVAASLSVRAVRTASAVFATSCGGISSTPISNTSGAGPVGTVPASASGGVGSGSGMPRGCPSSDRRAIHNSATSRARLRIRPNATARSVVEIAPRESRTLNACEHFRT